MLSVALGFEEGTGSGALAGTLAGLQLEAKFIDIVFMPFLCFGFVRACRMQKNRAIWYRRPN